MLLSNMRFVKEKFSIIEQTGKFLRAKERNASPFLCSLPVRLIKLRTTARDIEGEQKGQQNSKKFNNLV